MIAYSPGNAHLPGVPLGVVLDIAAPGDVLYHPNNVKRSFSWPVYVDKGQMATIDPNVEQTLFVSDAASALAVLSKFPEAFCLVFQNSRVLPEWLAEFSERVYIIHSEKTAVLLFTQVQELFARVLLWFAAMERAAIRRDSLQQLLADSAYFLNGFVYIYDQSKSLIAHHGSSLALPASYNEMLRTGIVDPGLILESSGLDLELITDNRIRVWVDRHAPERPYTRLFCSIKAEGGRLYDIVLVVAGERLTAGCCSLFALFVEFAQQCCQNQSRYDPLTNQAHHALFEKLLSGERVHSAYIEAQAKRLAVPVSGEFKLLQINFAKPAPSKESSKEPSKEQPSYASVSEAASRLNGGDCLVFPYMGSLFVLCYCGQNDSRLSTRNIDAGMRRHLLGHHRLVAYSSQVFSCLKDLCLAYRQTKIALDFRATIDTELSHKGDESILYSFEDALIFYLLTQQELDPQFLAFCFSHTILEKIHSEDIENGTDDVALLWLYIFCERKASAVAERMHMHRNTVLYRIERIMKRFDLDFSVQGTRDRLLLDFKLYFLVATGKHELGKHEPGKRR